jgi:TRAP-type mannitol/chloroaromatic compound transport system permease large subunit
MMIILIVLGFFIDEVSMMMITLPFFMPLVQRLDVDIIWFGVLFLLCMQIGLLSPPFGLILFAMKGVAPPHITMQQVMEAVMPYMYFGILLMLVVFMWPPVATWLPRLLMN